MGERKTGLGTLAPTLLRPTMPPHDDLAEAPTEDASDGQGRGEVAPTLRPTRPRRKRRVASGATTGRKLQLPDDVHDRLRLLAFQRKTNASAIAAEILDRNLPRFLLERQG
jgi:hypothetical protein